MGKIKILSSISTDKIISGTTCVTSPMVCATTRACAPQIIVGGLSDVHATALIQGKIDTTLNYQRYLYYKNEANTICFALANGATGTDFFPIFTGQVTCSNPALYFLGNSVTGTSTGTGIVTFEGRINNAGTTDSGVTLFNFTSGYGVSKAKIMADGTFCAINAVYSPSISGATICGGTCIEAPFLTNDGNLNIYPFCGGQMTANDLCLRGGNAQSGVTLSWGGDVNIKGGCGCASTSGCGGRTFILGGNSYSDTTAFGGDVYISGGSANGVSSGCGGNVYIGGGTGGTSNGKIYLYNLPAKSGETSILYINSAGKISSGVTSGGGMTWTGATVNGIGTYVSSTCICSQPTLTYDGFNLEFANNGYDRCISMAAAPASGTSNLAIYGAPMSASGSAAGDIRIYAGCGTYSSAALGGVAALCGGSARSTASGIGQGGAACVVAGCGYMGGTGVYACGGNSYLIGGNSCAPNFCSRGGSVCICAGCSTGCTYSYGGAIYLRSGNARSTVIPTTDNFTGGGSFNIYAGDACGTCGVIPTCGIGGGAININAGCAIASSGATYGGTVTIYAGHACGSVNCISNGGCLCFIGGRAWGNGGCINIWGGQSDCKGNAGDIDIHGGYASHCYGNGGTVNINGGISCGWNGCHAGDVCICGGAGWGRADGGNIYLKNGTVCAGSTGATGNIYIQGLPTGNTVGALLIESTGKVVSGETTDISGSLGTGQLLCYNGSTIVGTSDICMCSTAARYICMGNTTTSPACALTIQGTNIIASTSTGGAVSICGGSSSGTSTNIGGTVNVCGGCGCNTSSGAACGGSINMYAGNAYDANNVAVNLGGCINIRAGCAKCVSGSGSFGGSVVLISGSGTTGGDVCIAGHCGSTTHGDVFLQAVPSYLVVACGTTSCTTAYVSLRYGLNNEKLTTVTNGICLNTNCGFGVDWVATSDCRLKTNIQPISNALSIVTQLEGVSYQLCDDCTCECHIGLIAQEVDKYLPEVVSHSAPNQDDFKYGICDEKLGLKYDKLTAVLIEAIKEQQIQINELKLEIERIKTC